MNKRCMGCMNEYSEELEMCPFCGYICNAEPESPLHMEAGTYLADRYIVGRVVGYGGFGVTYIGWDAKLEQRVAIKEYLPSEFSTRAPGHSKLTIYSGDKAEQFAKGLDKFTDEAKRLAKFQNTTGIVKVFDSFEENETAYIIMEYLEGETLAEKLKRDGVMPAEDAVALLMPIMQSLEEVHKEGILHRDIAPDNIFITKDGDAKLIDFGAARYATTGYSMSLTVLIKPGYSPEEQYRTRGDQGPHTDVYSMAATLYKTITGKTPPDSLKRRVEFEKSNKDILFPIHKFAKDIPESTENAVMNALNVRIEDRTPTMEAFIAELKSDNVKRVGNKIRRIDLLRWPLWAKIAVPLTALALIVTGVLFAMGVIGFSSNLKNDTEIPDGMTRIPNVVNTELSSAEEKLSELDLLIYIEGQEFSNDIPMNYIKSQNPSGGSVVDKMSNINVNISAGIDGEVVPDLYGLPLEDAKAQLEALSFLCEVVEDYDATIAAGCVMKQSAEAGKEAARGSTVTLTVSLGRDPSVEYPTKEVKVINFVGMTYKDAIKSAARAELVIKVSEKKYSDTVPENTVMAQSVPADSVITNDNVVELTVSLGKKSVLVPYVIGAAEADAIAALEGRELTVTVVYKDSNTFAHGLVMSQSVEAKKKVSAGTAITITVSKGAASFNVPSVVGKNEATAKSLLNGKGLKVSVTYAKDSSVPEGNVISQAPASGSVKAGDTVTITVSSGKPSRVVEDVVGKTQSEAEKKLKEQKFSVAATYGGYSATVPYGSVLSQNPAAGTSQIEGSVITLILSKGPDWSEFSDTLPDNVKGNDAYEIKTQTLYRYKDKQTTTSSDSSLSGWTQYDSSWYWSEYGSWSEWTKNYVSETDSRKVETTTLYGYYAFICPNCGYHNAYWNGGGCTNGDCSEDVLRGCYYEKWLTTPHGSSGQVIDQSGKWTINANDNYNKWRGLTSSGEYQTATGYRYKERYRIYTYYYYKWGDWSNYSTTKYTETDNRQVDQKTQYSYRRK